MDENKSITEDDFESESIIIYSADAEETKQDVQTTETTDIVEIQEQKSLAIEIEETNQDVQTTETIDVVEIQEQEPMVIEIEEGVGWAASDSTRHYSLAGRDEDNQHPINAIIGLQDKLDAIEALKTEYSDKPNVANYYEWEDAEYDECGYFVSIVPKTSKIQICDGKDIFGVSVNNAGFIGNEGYREIKDASGNVIRRVRQTRDNKYGLIVTSGLVGVRCELNVEVGDYVVSNSRGYAKKSGSNYGYKVLALEVDDNTGIEYAIIMLGVQADVTNSIGVEITDIDERLDAAESNIISAVNVANQAYNKASEVETSNRTMSDKVDGALDTVDKVVSDVKDLSSQVSNSALISAQARAIAESAATSAESMRNEAVEKANEALVDTSELRKELEAKVAEIDTELDNTALELEATKEGFDETINDLKLDTEGQLADFKKEVEDNYATTTQLAAVKTENSDAVAALKQEVSDTYATTESVTSLKTETSDALTGFKQEVSETYATQEMLTGLETETGKALTDYKQEVTDTYATQEMVTTLEKNTSKALADYKQEVQAGYATQEMVTKLEKDTSKALSDYKQEVTNTYATQTSLTTLRTDTTNAITASEEKATKTYASKSDLTSFESDTNVAMARIEQKADANGAYIQSTVSNMDKYAVGPYSQAYGFTLEQAASVLEAGMIYVPTESVTEKYEYTENNTSKPYERSFTRGYLYRWGQPTGYPCGWITVDKDYSEDKLNTSAPAVYFATEVPSVSGEFGYWYTDGDTVADGYEPYTLYKWESYEYEDGDNESEATQTGYHWVAVATLAGNSSNRAVSQIRQDENSIALEVTNINGALAGINTTLESDHAKVESVAAWPSDAGNNKYNMALLKQHSDGNSAHLALAAIRNVSSDVNKPDYKIDELGGAKIVLSDDDDGSYIQMDAKRINFTSDDYTNIAKNITLKADQINFSAGDFGGENLLLDSGKTRTINAKPTIQTYTLTENLMAGETYTVSMSITPGSDVNKICLYMVGTANWDDGIVRITPTGTGQQEIAKTFTVSDKATLTSTKVNLNVYNVDGSGAYNHSTEKSTIHWIKLEHGRVATSWSPAPGEYSGENLVLNSDLEISSSNYSITGSNPYHVSTPLVEGKTYMVSMEVTPAANVTQINVHLSQGQVCSGSSVNIPVSGTKKQTISKEWTVSYYPNYTPEDDIKNSYIQLCRWPEDIANAGNTTIHWIKIEEGYTSTPWSPAPSEKLDSEQTRTSSVMKWRMLPEKCVWWNNFTDTGSEDAPLMKLDAEGLEVHGKGDFTGKITASSGSIGAWNIGTIPNPNDNFWGNASYTNSLYTISTNNSRTNISTTSGLNDTTKDYYLAFLRMPYCVSSDVIGVRRKPAGGGAAESIFSLAKNGHLTASSVKLGTGTLGSSDSIFLSTSNMSGTVCATEKTDWRMTVGSNFGVTSNGNLNAKNVDLTGKITATSGQIGGCKIEDGKLLIETDNITYRPGFFKEENLLLGSGKPNTAKGSTLLKRYQLTEKLVDGETYTVSMEVTIGSDAKHVCLYMNSSAATYDDGIVRFENLTPGNHFLKKTFPVKVSDGKPDITTTEINLNIYKDYNPTTAPTESSTIRWIKLERGKTEEPSWSLAPGDQHENLLLGSGQELSFKSTHKHVYTPSSYLTAKKVYTVSMEVTPGTKQYTTTEEKNNPTRIMLISASNGNASYGKGGESEGYVAGKYLNVSGTTRQVVTGTWKFDYYYDSTNNIYHDPISNILNGAIGVYSLVYDSNSETYVTACTDTVIHWIKIEEGYVATPWCASPGDGIPTKQISKALKWDCSDGKMIWWNDIEGTNKQDSPLMRLDGTGLFVKGEIEATSGKFGNLRLNGSMITSGDSGITFNTDANDGYIKTAGMIVSHSLKVSSIQGTASESSLSFNGSSQNYTTVTVKFNVHVEEEGTSGIFGIGYSNGKLTVVASATDSEGNSFNFLEDKILTVSLSYSNGTSKTLDIVIKKGMSAGSASTTNRINLGSYECTTTSISPQTFSVSIGVTEQNIICDANFVPDQKGKYNLGTLNKYWGQMCVDNIHNNNQYNLTGAIASSDANKKNTIMPIGEKYSALFDMLNPVSFKLNDGTSGRTHTGLIAQELKFAMDSCGIDSKDFAAYCSWKEENGNEACGIRYGEFVSLCIYEIQKLKTRVAELEEKTKQQEKLEQTEESDHPEQQEELELLETSEQPEVIEEQEIQEELADQTEQTE